MPGGTRQTEEIIMSDQSNNELRVLVKELQTAVAYRAQNSHELERITQTIADWSAAGEAQRRDIFFVWRNKDNF
jgi:hypothetical protein